MRPAVPAWITDALLVAAIVVVGALPIGEASGEASAAFTVALALPLLARRQRPVAAFATVAAVALVQWVADIRAFGDIALLIALYSVAATQPVVRLGAAFAVLEAGILAVTIRWAIEKPLYAFIGLSALATAAAVLGVNTRNRRALVASLEERAARLEYERDQQGRLAAAAERARIAREMHDIVAHNLSVMIALADGAAAEPLPPGLQLAAFRIVQEALTNTLKHAGRGATAHVRLAFEPEALTVEVSDTGTASGAAPTQDGGGLRGMRERAGVYGGVLEAGPSAGGGWRVSTRLTALGELVA